jgi:hypothetical protein
MLSSGLLVNSATDSICDQKFYSAAVKVKDLPAVKVFPVPGGP